MKIPWQKNQWSILVLHEECTASYRAVYAFFCRRNEKCTEKINCIPECYSYKWDDFFSSPFSSRRWKIILRRICKHLPLPHSQTRWDNLGLEWDKPYNRIKAFHAGLPWLISSWFFTDVQNLSLHTRYFSAVYYVDISVLTFQCSCLMYQTEPDSHADKPGVTLQCSYFALCKRYFLHYELIKDRSITSSGIRPALGSIPTILLAEEKEICFHSHRNSVVANRTPAVSVSALPSFWEMHISPVKCIGLIFWSMLH